MRNRSVVAVDNRDEVMATHYMPAELAQKFAVAERRRQHWIWALIVSTVLTGMGLVIWLANRV